MTQPISFFQTLPVEAFVENAYISIVVCCIVFSRNIVYSDHWLVSNQGVFGIDRGNGFKHTVASPAESISTAQKSWLTKQKGSQPQLRVIVLHACNKERFFSGQDRDSQTVAICIHRRRDYHQGPSRYMVGIVKRCFSQHLLHWVFFPFFPRSCRT